ncbi:MAG: carbohydrate binding family 9 domain-containing protein [Bacteroidales bacterium]|nr:carbohydrate binding family 9 domain-containing protein [Bacteroidales bacterium]
MKNLCCCGFNCFFKILIPLFSYAQSPQIIQKLESEPSLDGNPFESAWNEVQAYPMIMLNPVSGNSTSQKTDLKIGYTDKYLYVAGYMFDNEPQKIRAASKERDDMSLSNDWFGIGLDIYNDNENAMFFSTNPAGLRLDAQIFNDGQGSFPVQRDWNTVWEVETLINEKGWFAEMRIPLSSLRYVTSEGKVVMGLGSSRYISRLAEWDCYPQISNEWGFWSWAKPSQYHDVEFQGMNSINPLYFSPYVLGGFEQKTLLNDAEDAYEPESSWERQAGIEIKYGISKNFTLDLTVNTDFAQVEADDQQVNLTRFSLFFPEKRQFFLERSGIFDFTFGSTGQLFYSRRIGIDNGQMVPIWGGLRLTGRTGDWDVGLMSLQTAFLKDNEKDEEILPTINNSAVRLRKKINLNSNSYLGGLVTSRIDAHGSYNIGYGFDAILNLFRNDYLNIVLARTSDTAKNEHPILSPSKIYMQWERRTYQGLSYDLNYTQAGSKYNPEMGFEYRKDFTRYGGILRYGWIPGDQSRFLKRYQIGLNSYIYFRNLHHQVETARITPSYQFITKKDHGFTMSIPIQYENFTDDFYLSSDAYIPAGDYTFFEFQFDYSSPAGDILYWESSVSSGRYYDGWKNSFAVSSSIVPEESWNIDLGYEVNRINFNSREQKFLSHLANIRILYMYSISTSASSFLQYNSLNKRIIWNVRFHYNPKEGNDFYVVYNDNLNVGRTAVQPELPFSNQRTVLLKYTHTFRVR